jgi:hypothetical protein
MSFLPFAIHSFLNVSYDMTVPLECTLLLIYQLFFFRTWLDSRLAAFGRVLWDLFDKNDEMLMKDQVAREFSNYSATEIDYCLQSQASCNKIMMVEEGAIYRI